jgi:hypothetical protein
MKTKSTNKVMQNKDIASVFVVTAAILMVMSGLFTGEVKWTLFDFALMGTLLVGTGLLLVLAMRKIKNINHRVAFIVALVAVLLLVWIELAVGLFGTPLSGQ